MTYNCSPGAMPHVLGLHKEGQVDSKVKWVSHTSDIRFGKELWVKTASNSSEFYPLVIVSYTRTFVLLGPSSTKDIPSVWITNLSVPFTSKVYFLQHDSQSLYKAYTVCIKLFARKTQQQQQTGWHVNTVKQGPSMDGGAFSCSCSWRGCLQSNTTMWAQLFFTWWRWFGFILK